MAAQRGALIVLEGVDRAGKSTQARRLVSALCSAGRRAELLRFPGGWCPQSAGSKHIRAGTAGPCFRPRCFQLLGLSPVLARLGTSFLLCGLFKKFVDPCSKEKMQSILGGKQDYKSVCCSCYCTGVLSCTIRITQAGYSGPVKPGPGLRSILFFRPLIKEKLSQGVTLIVDRYAFSGVAFTSAKELQLADAAVRGEFGQERYEDRPFQERALQCFHQLMADTTLNWKIVDASRSIEDIHMELLALCEDVICTAAQRPLGELWK
ncbi:thymidylate kinase [Otolemur garnettii]|uniref:thymidylate kinase n=1 Tax=Otolemur garnettii TaxID=30611 RepID=UPI000C7EAC47|nr:thymidylate kinase [Otolemur garnettii]